MSCKSLRDIASTLAKFSKQIGWGDAVAEVAPVYWSKAVYDMLGFSISTDGKHQRRIVLEHDSAKLVFCVLPLHPKGWGIYAVAGLLQLDGETYLLSDGQRFLFSSTALQAPQEVKEAALDWLLHLLHQGFVGAE